MHLSLLSSSLNILPLIFAHLDKPIHSSPHQVSEWHFAEAEEYEYRPRILLGGAIMEEDKDEDGVDGEENREAEMKNESKVKTLI
ncbi:hypothetical protein JAAARDRAFT_198332 [Jaapia argillacea MUCL 33604]|uniref:Uncharacterized protein n=1 Tax=Jaapia argillacea MUCL 33604 TaxID=933084 RepID=A0A067PQ28_9AGAM|nr:hypothetical protein JAAARDRAFT_198332 [Jaapia argillacea MUCL 33604]